MTKVSVIIPMYNEERYIGRCLESLKEQTFKDFEVILIDDGSKDNTVEIAESFKKDFQLTILEQKHGGPGKARNRGAKEAKGDILIFVDSDMHFDKNYIKFLIQPIVDGKEIGTSHGTELVGNKENPIAAAYSVVKGLGKEGERSGVYRAILKKVFLDAGGFDSSKGYFDDDLSKINEGKGSYVVEKAICYHNNPESFKEIYKHEIWVGKGFTQKEILWNYMKSYKLLLVSFFVLFVLLLVLVICTGKWLWLLFGILVLVLLFFIIRIVVREKNDKKYINTKRYLRYIPLVLMVRGVGNMVGFCKGLIYGEKH